MKTFIDWVAEKHPDIHLTEQQVAVAKAIETGAPLSISMGRAGGRKFVLQLFLEYTQEEKS